MRSLLVLAHPVADSLNGHLADTAAEAIRARGWPLEVLDLNAMRFDPVLSAAERVAYYGKDTPPEDEELARMMDQLREAQMIVLVFPTWWFGFPAILKGWFDRVWRPGVAFRHSPDMARILPELTSLHRVVAITTMGSPLWIDRLVLRQPLRRVLKYSILRPCAPQARMDWLALHNAEVADKAGVDRFAARIRRAIARLPE